MSDRPRLKDAAPAKTPKSKIQKRRAALRLHFWFLLLGSPRAYRPAGLGVGAACGILNSVVQFEHFTFFPRAVSGTTRIERHFKFGHMMRMFLTGFMFSPVQRLVIQPCAGKSYRAKRRPGLDALVHKSQEKRPTLADRPSCP